MTAESKRQEHSRLQKRTEKLQEEHAGLGRDRKPFDQGEHDDHTAKLKEHKDALARHRTRGPER
jgi:cytochrome c556